MEEKKNIIPSNHKDTRGKFDFKKRKDTCVASLFEVENFLRQAKQVYKGICFYKFFK